MKKILILFMAVISLQAKAQLTLNDVTLSAKLKVEQSDLTLNGGGVRKKVFFKVYVAGLYLTQKSNNAVTIVNDNQPAAVRLQITSSVVSSSNMSESIREGFDKSTGGKTAPLKDKIEAFINTFSKEEIKEGDVFLLYYNPAEGIKAYKNGVLKSTTAGLDFKKALFGIWFGENPVDADLKKGMLGS